MECEVNVELFFRQLQLLEDYSYEEQDYPNYCLDINPLKVVHGFMCRRLTPCNPPKEFQKAVDAGTSAFEIAIFSNNPNSFLALRDFYGAALLLEYARRVKAEYNVIRAEKDVERIIHGQLAIALSALNDAFKCIPSKDVANQSQRAVELAEGEDKFVFYKILGMNLLDDGRCEEARDAIKKGRDLAPNQEERAKCTVLLNKVTTQKKQDDDDWLVGTNAFVGAKQSCKPNSATKKKGKKKKVPTATLR